MLSAPGRKVSGRELYRPLPKYQGGLDLSIAGQNGGVAMGPLRVTRLQLLQPLVTSCCLCKESIGVIKPA